MSGESPHLTSQMVNATVPFASSEFTEYIDVQPSDERFDLGGVSHAAPFQTTVTNILGVHTMEIRDNVQPRVLSALDTSKHWKRRLREFILTRANKILENLAKPISSHPTLSRAEYLIRRFGRKSFDPTNQSLRDVTLDASGVNMIEQLNKGLDAISTKGIRGYSEQTQYLFDMYRSTGEEILRLEEGLQIRLTIFDKVQEKISGIEELQANECFQPLAEAMEKYLEKIFDDNSIDKCYNDIIEAYRRFIALREIVIRRRGPVITENQPLCVICCDEPIMYTLTPCGHCFCQKCLHRQINNCYLCRTAVKDRIRIYFG